MADRGSWLRALALVADGRDVTGDEPCPNCGRDRLRVRYIVDPDSRTGHALFWCDACLHGITVSRVRAPEHMPTWPIGDPDSTAGVPDFVRHD
ncbi:hypothetical protein [Streptomyces sp. NPDC088261]|uniref:hypothetical protein n=1 Tax=Streptomyces sp. NPDC088261 TaxID=3365851 RepID=UPI003808D433